MNTPCGCCEHYGDGGGDVSCLNCKYNKPDNFEPSGKCATCVYDPRKYGICGMCIDFDQYQERSKP